MKIILLLQALLGQIISHLLSILFIDKLVRIITKINI